MFPFKWKLSAKLLATIQKEPNYKGLFFVQYTQSCHRCSALKYWGESRWRSFLRPLRSWAPGRISSRTRTLGRNFPADIRSQCAEMKGQMQTSLKHLQNVGHTHWHVPEYCLTHQSSLSSHHLLHIFVIPKSILMAFHKSFTGKQEQ